MREYKRYSTHTHNAELQALISQEETLKRVLAP